MTGITIIIIILVVIAFQVIMLQVRQDKRHNEIKKTLNRIEENLEGQPLQKNEND